MLVRILAVLSIVCAASSASQNITHTIGPAFRMLSLCFSVVDTFFALQSFDESFVESLSGFLGSP